MFACLLAGVVLGFLIGAVWSSEVHARKPSVTGWSIPTIAPLPSCVARPAVTRRNRVRS